MRVGLEVGDADTKLIKHGLVLGFRMYWICPELLCQIGDSLKAIWSYDSKVSQKLNNLEM